MNGPGRESPRPPQNFKRKYVAIGKHVVTVVVKDKRKCVTFVKSRVRDNCPPVRKRNPHGVFECVTIIMEPAGSLESTRARTFV